MNKLILTLFSIGMFFIIGCSQNSVELLEKEVDNYQSKQDYCTSDSECVLKPNPYCCAENVEHIDNCFFINDEPESISCEGNTVCPGFQRVIDCKCEVKECVNIVE